ncbi:regulator of G-protein signaling 9-binding protein A-like isoform X1 [Folsomia candida]|uniref:regulator of G-protein signaling 9-binding protein A-like isoform X1 n=1 Tax=Folsomia candida TaxID=158441 RepID=UPI0016054038|nr:regulator of G-protein signaling 9-binding protein A-like isoform X1 [Folsomia candida]
MWRRESIGAVSVVVGEVGVSSTTSAHHPTDANTQWNRHHHHHHHHPIPRRFDSTELADSPVRHEAVKLVRELNRAVAGHVALASLLGGSGDGPHLRDELRRARRTAQEAAAAAKSTLLPFLLESGFEKERMELVVGMERLWYLVLCCLDALDMSMQRCLALLREFSLADGGNNVVIHTGIECPNHLVTRSATNTQEKAEMNVDVKCRDRISLEGVEASQLCKELFELRAQLTELKTTVELRSLSVPDFDDMNDSSKAGPRRTDTLISINGTDGMGASGGMGSPSCSIPSDDKESLESDASQGTGITNAQRRCVCWILGVMVAMFFLAMILGVFIALFS